MLLSSHGGWGNGGAVILGRQMLLIVRIDAATVAPWLNPVYTQIGSWGYLLDRFHLVLPHV